jgi:hypothetical protein
MPAGKVISNIPKKEGGKNHKNQKKHDVGKPVGAEPIGKIGPKIMATADPMTL